MSGSRNNKGKGQIDESRPIAPGNRKTPRRRTGGVVITERSSDTLMSSQSPSPSPGHVSTSDSPMSSHDMRSQSPSPTLDHVSSQSSVRRRGYAKNLSLHKGTSKKDLNIPEDMKRVVGDNARSFINETGILVRALIPPSHKRYDLVPVEILNDIRQRLADKFNLQLANGVHWKTIEGQMISSANEYRYELGKYYRNNVQKFGEEQADRMKHPRVHSDDEWGLLIEKLKSPEFKKLSETNTHSRAAVPYLHKGGSKSNANKLYEMRQDNPEATWVDVFEQQHSYESPKTWVSGQAEEHHKKMVEYMNPPQVASDTTDSSPSITDIEAMEMTLGHRPGYRRGMGRGPKPPPRSSSSSRSSVSSQVEQLTQSQQQLAQSQQQLVEALTTIEELRARDVERETREAARDLEARKLREDFDAFMRNYRGGGGGGGDGHA